MSDNWGKAPSWCQCHLSVTNQMQSTKTIQTPKYEHNYFTSKRQIHSLMMRKSKLKLGKSYQATYICQYQSESDGSESERFQPGVKSIFKPSSFGVKTEQTLLDAVAAYNFLSTFCNWQNFIITFPLELRNHRPKAIQT